MDDQAEPIKQNGSLVLNEKARPKGSPSLNSVSSSGLRTFLSNSSISESDSELTEGPILYDERWQTSNLILDHSNGERAHEGTTLGNDSVLTKSYDQGQKELSYDRSKTQNSSEQHKKASKLSSREISELERKEVEVLRMKHISNIENSDQQDQHDDLYDNSSIKEGMEFEKSGNYYKAKDRYLDTLLIQKKIKLSYQLDLEMIKSFRRLASINCKLDEKQLAINHYKEAIRIYEQHEKDFNGNLFEWEEYLITLYDLARIYFNLKKYKQAIFLYEKAIDVLLDYKGDTNHLIYPDICYHIGLAYRKANMRHEAYMYHCRQLIFYEENCHSNELMKNAQTKRAPNLLEQKSNEEKFRILNRLCILFGKKKEYKEALYCCDFLHNLFSNGARVSMEDIILSHINSGNVFSAFHRIDDAIESYTRAIDISNKTSESTTLQNGIGRSEILYNIATLYWKQGSTEDASQYFQKFLDSSDLIGTKDAESDSRYRSILIKKAIALHYLGNIRCNMGELKSGIEFFEESLKFRCFLHGEVSEKTMETKYDLGKAYFDAKKFDSAQMIFKNLLLGEGKNKPEGLERANLLFKLGKVDMVKKEFSDATTKFKESLNIKQETLDEDDYSILKTMHSIALAESHSGNHEQAIPILEDVKKKYSSKFKDSNPLHAKINLDMAKIYLLMGEIIKAEENCMNAIKGFKLAQRTKQHPHVMQSLKMLQKIRARKESMLHSWTNATECCEIILV